MGTGVFLGARLRLAPRHTPGTQWKLSFALVHKTGEGQGSVRVRSGGDSEELRAGDSAQYSADQPHAIENTSNRDTVVFLVVTYARD